MARKLTERQAAFCRHLITGASAAEAARKAGYSAKTADKLAYQLLENPRVREELERLRSDADSAAVMTLKQLQEWWTRVILEGDIRDGLKASELLAKSQGGFTDKLETSGSQRIEVVYVDS